MEKKKRKVKNIRTYYLSDEDFEIQEKLEDIAYKERVALSIVIVDAIKEYVIKHGDGNPVFTLDQFAEDETMKAVPAFFRTRNTWKQYIDNLDSKGKQLQELLWQSQTINSLLEKKSKYDSTNVRFI